MERTVSVVLPANKKRKAITKGRYTKRSRTSYRGRGRATMVRFPGPSAIPDVLRTKLVYVNAGAIAAGVGVTGAAHIFNLNSLFDPDRTGAGHQPLGYDQLCPALYNRYRVWSVTVELWAKSGMATDGAVMFILPSNDATVLTNFNTVLESPRCSRLNFRNLLGQSDAADTGYIKQFVSLPSIVGATKAQYGGSDRYQALSSADPSEIIVAHVGLTSVGGNTNTATGGFTVRLTYACEFFDRVQLAAS